MGMGSDKDVKGSSTQHTMWSTLVSGQKLAGGVQVGGQQLKNMAAHKRAVDAGKLRMAGVDKPAIQKGMGNGGFGDRKVKAANTAAEPLWDSFKAKSGKL